MNEDHLKLRISSNVVIGETWHVLSQLVLIVVMQIKYISEGKMF